MKYIIDIDGTICKDTDNSKYENAIPIPDRIEHFNLLYDLGHEIHYWSARGSATGKNHYDFTLYQLKQWKAKFHSFRLGKPTYDVWIDDKAINVEDYFNENISNRV